MQVIAERGGDRQHARSPGRPRSPAPTPPDPHRRTRSRRSFSSSRRPPTPSIEIRTVAPGPGSWCASVRCKLVAARLTCPYQVVPGPPAGPPKSSLNPRKVDTLNCQAASTEKIRNTGIVVLAAPGQRHHSGSGTSCEDVPVGQAVLPGDQLQTLAEGQLDLVTGAQFGPQRLGHRPGFGVVGMRRPSRFVRLVGFLKDLDAGCRSAALGPAAGPRRRSAPPRLH
jgi:hypothetical protein